MQYSIKMFHYTNCDYTCINYITSNVIFNEYTFAKNISNQKHQSLSSEKTNFTDDMLSHAQNYYVYTIMNHVQQKFVMQQKIKK